MGFCAGGFEEYLSLEIFLLRDRQWSHIWRVLIGGGEILSRLGRARGGDK